MRANRVVFSSTGDDTYRAFMQTMASRYAGKVQVYEIWNAENLWREMGVGNVAPATVSPSKT